MKKTLIIVLLICCTLSFAQTTIYKYQLTFAFKQINEPSNNGILKQVFSTSEERGDAILEVSKNGKMLFEIESGINNNQSQGFKINFVKDKIYTGLINDRKIKYTESIGEKKYLVCDSIPDIQWTRTEQTRETNLGIESQLVAIKLLPDSTKVRFYIWYLPQQDTFTSIENWGAIPGVITEFKEDNPSFTKVYTLKSYKGHSNPSNKNIENFLREKCITIEELNQKKQELQNRIMMMYGIDEGVDTQD